MDRRLQALGPKHNYVVKERFMNSSELIAKCRRQLTVIEEMSAKGVCDLALVEMARLSALANQLRSAGEAEFRAAREAADTRGLAHRDQIAGAA
jgi:hypothetical protein